MKKTVFVILAAVLILLSGCNGENNESSAVSETVKDYSISVITAGGMPLENVRVTAKDRNGELVWTATTDKNGRVEFSAKESDITATLTDVPKGYAVKPEYELTEDSNEIVLDAMIQEADISNVKFGLGSIICDFEVTDANGNSYRISELLNEKKAVILNFWYLNCDPCKLEFPFLQQSYNDYKEDIEVLAINPLDGTDTKIKAFAAERELSFPMIAGDSEWAECFSLTAYPTTVVIDRYGMIAMIHKGMVTEKETFDKIFEYFTAEDYKQTIIKNSSEIE